MPSLAGATEWLAGEAEPTAKTLRGRPALIHFWSVGCEICKANIPRIGELRDAHASDGLRVVAVHLPRFQEETDTNMVRQAMERLDIMEPCAVDNAHRLRDAFANEQGYVPAYYLFDADAKLRAFAAGERGLNMIAPALDRMLGRAPTTDSRDQATPMTARSGEPSKDKDNAEMRATPTAAQQERAHEEAHASNVGSAQALGSDPTRHSPSTNVPASTPRGEVASTPPTRSPQAFTPSALRAASYCTQCGVPLEEDSRFCSFCGKPVSLRTSRGGVPAHPRAGASGGTGEHGATDNLAAPGTPKDSLLGHTLDGKYELIERLGQGGMSVVYRARRSHIGDEVAVKVLLQTFVMDEAAVERFRREARAAAMLRHTNVVTIHDFGETQNADAPAYIVMELIEGMTLRAVLKKEGRLSPQRAVELMRDICAGVGAAHRRHVIHRDVKPDNIVVIPPADEYDRETVKVVDFGIAKLRDMAGAMHLTQTGAVMGTPYYMSPEQCRGEPLDARSDVYSLGAMLYEMLAGTPPFTAESLTGMIAKHLYEPPPPLPWELEVPPMLEAVMLRALAKKPEARQQDATELARALQASLRQTVP